MSRGDGNILRMNLLDHSGAMRMRLPLWGVWWEIHAAQEVLEARLSRRLPYLALLVEEGRASLAAYWSVSNQPTMRKSAHHVADQSGAIALFDF